ncbi:MAG TPA: Lateral flagellin, partial [Cellvibrio sp.]
MALSIHTNYSSLVTQTNLNKTNNTLSTNQQRLGTGLRINSAADDAAGLQIATRLNAQSRGMEVAIRNTGDSISLLQTAEGAFNETTDILQRMKDLATQAANDTNSAADRTSLQTEFDELSAEITNIFNNTKF